MNRTCHRPSIAIPINVVPTSLKAVRVQLACFIAKTNHAPPAPAVAANIKAKCTTRDMLGNSKLEESVNVVFVKTIDGVVVIKPVLKISKKKIILPTNYYFCPKKYRSNSRFLSETFKTFTIFNTGPSRLQQRM